MRHARHLSGMSTGLEAPPWPSVRRGRHFLDASPVEEVSPWRVRYGRHFADSPRNDRPPGTGTARSDQQGPLSSLEGIVREFPASMLQVVAGAVDPLEIAASLETCGLSNAVVHERFGYRDTFTLAEQLYSTVEFRAAPATELHPNRPGGMPESRSRPGVCHADADVWGCCYRIALRIVLVDGAACPYMRLGL